MKSTNITLTFNGETETVFNFYKSVFGGEFTNLQRMRDVPGPEKMPEEEADKILYISMNVGQLRLAGMDIPKGRGEAIAGTNFLISLDTDSEDETDQLFNKLSDGGVVMFAPGPQFWATYFAMFTDRFGIQWMLTYNQ